MHAQSNNRNTRKRCDIYSKLQKTPERLQQCCSGAVVGNFEHDSHHGLVFLLLTLNKQMFAGVTNSIARERL